MTTDGYRRATVESPVAAGAGTWLRDRDRQPEVMDQPGLDAGLHAQALGALERINRLSRTARALWRPIRALARERSGSRPLRVLDVASGGGDVAIALARQAARERIDLWVEGCDISERAVDYARRSALRRGAANIAFRQRDVLRESLPQGFDVIVSSLFLHHLDEQDAGRLLRGMADAAERLALISDLRRTRVGYLLATLVSRVVTRSPVVRVDGPLSVAAAFTPDEVLEMARRNGMAEATLKWIWPQRFLLAWRRPG